MSLKIHRRGDLWHYRGTVAGRRLRGSTGTADKETAQRIAAERETREWKSHLDGPEAVLTFAQAAILYRSANKSDRFLEKIEDYWKNTTVKSITAGAIKQSALVLYPKAAASTRNRQAIVPTQAIINHAASLELCRPIRVQRFQIIKTSKEPADWEWISAFMQHAIPHLAALACFMFLTGARITEAVELRWGDVDLTKGRALIKQTKIGAERRAHLPPILVAALANIPSNKEPGEKVFRYSSRFTTRPQWFAAIRRAKIKPLSFHSCRHGFATAMLHKGIDPITVSKLGGWKSAQHVFSTYGHAMSDDTLANMIVGTNLTQETQPDKINKINSIR